MELTINCSTGGTWSAMGCWNTTVRRHIPSPSPSPIFGFHRFHVDEESDLYYDPTPLYEYLKEEREESAQSSDPVHHEGPTPLMAHRQLQSNISNQYSMNGMGVSPSIAASPRHLGGPIGTPHGGSFAAIPPTQFYSTDRGSPMVPRGGMIMDGIGITPDIRRRM